MEARRISRAARLHAEDMALSIAGTSTVSPPPIRCGRYLVSFGGRAVVMGIINVTPDSFSGDGLRNQVDAVEQAERFVDEGADILDVGGESTRPGSEGVPAAEELRRVIPVIQRLAACCDRPISVDTSKPEVAREAIAAGATIINDVWGLRQPGMLELAAETGVAVCIMHMQGQPRDMQQAPAYADVVGEVRAFLAQRVSAAIAAGIAESRIILDPGFGFGKTAAHNLELVRRLGELCSLGRPVLLGASRKRTLGELTGRTVEDRLAGTVTMHTMGVAQGASLVRVHDVAAAADMVRIVAAVQGRDWQRPPVRVMEAGAS